MSQEAVSAVFQYGPGVAAAAFVLGALKIGWLATRQEVDAWKGRAERAEKQVDNLIPAVEKLTDAITGKNLS